MKKWLVTLDLEYSEDSDLDKGEVADDVWMILQNIKNVSKVFISDVELYSEVE